MCSTRLESDAAAVVWAQLQGTAVDLLAADGALGLPEGGGPLPLELLGLLGLLLSLGKDLNKSVVQPPFSK